MGLLYLYLLMSIVQCKKAFAIRKGSKYRVGHKDLPLSKGHCEGCSGGREVGVVSCGWLASTVVSTHNGLDR